MRIHKNGEAIQKPVNDYPVTIHKKNSEDKKFLQESQIKQEPLEPIVEINEHPHGFPSTIGWFTTPKNEHTTKHNQCKQ